MNSALPLDRSGSSRPQRGQRQRRAAAARHRRAAALPCSGRGSPGGTIRWRSRGAERRGVPRRPRSPLRRRSPTSSGAPPRRQRGARPLALGRIEGEPGDQLGGDLLDRVRADVERQQRPQLGRQRRRERAVTSAMPECAADSGSAPQAAASAATMPNASGNVLGMTWASHAGSRSGRSSCSSRPVKWTRSAAAGAAASHVRPGARRGTRAGSSARPRPALELAAARGDVARSSRSRRRSASTKRSSASR